MRNSFALLGYLTILTAPLAIGTTFAHDMDNMPTSSYDSSANDRAGNVHPTTASLPRHSYEHGDQYVANPTEMTNTRDNRGSVYNTDTSYRPTNTPNAPGNPNNAGYTPTSYQNMPTTYQSVQ